MTYQNPIDQAVEAANVRIAKLSARLKAERLRRDAKLLDSGMDPDLVRELHAEADALDPPLQPHNTDTRHERLCAAVVGSGGCNCAAGDQL